MEVPYRTIKGFLSPLPQAKTTPVSCSGGGGSPHKLNLWRIYKGCLPQTSYYHTLTLQGVCLPMRKVLLVNLEAYLLVIIPKNEVSMFRSSIHIITSAKDNELVGWERYLSLILMGLSPN